MRWVSFKALFMHVFINASTNMSHVTLNDACPSDCDVDVDFATQIFADYYGCAIWFDFIIYLGHIQYYIQYKDQPFTLQKGANPGFHEAVGDTIALSVANPRHLRKVGLLEEFDDTTENNLNALYAEALERIAFLPFGLVVDKWRWDVFSGKVNESEWNAHWWKLRGQYQRLEPPVERNEDHFDPGAKFHVPASSKYISYFISHILEFQLYKSLCTAAKEYIPAKKPLHKCDFYGSKEAGQKLAWVNHFPAF